MARSFFDVMVVVALLLSSTMAVKSLSITVIPTPHKKSLHHSRVVSPFAKTPVASPSTGVSPSSGSPTGAPSSISSARPSGAPGPTQNAAFLNRFTVTASATIAIFSVALLM